MWDQKYAGATFFYGTEPNDYLKAQALKYQSSLFKPRANILSLGEGEGRNAVFLASLGMHVTAVDQSAAGLMKAQRLATERGANINVLVTDLAHYTFAENHWDGIISLWCHLPTRLRQQVHASVIQSLKPGGVFLLECYRPEQLAYATGGPKDLDLLPTLDELLHDFAHPAIQVLEAQAIDRLVIEGTGHHGNSAVNQLMLRRTI